MEITKEKLIEYGFEFGDDHQKWMYKDLGRDDIRIGVKEHIDIQNRVDSNGVLRPHIMNIIGRVLVIKDWNFNRLNAFIYGMTGEWLEEKVLVSNDKAKLIDASPDLLEALEYCLNCLGDEFALPDDCIIYSEKAIEKAKKS